MTKTVYGTIHGKTIELEEDLGVADGQKVEVQVRIPSAKNKLPGPPPGWQPGGSSPTAGLLAESWTDSGTIP